jgi:hypothetical protein
MGGNGFARVPLLLGSLQPAQHLLLDSLIVLRPQHRPWYSYSLAKSLKELTVLRNYQSRSRDALPFVYVPNPIAPHTAQQFAIPKTTDTEIIDLKVEVLRPGRPENCPKEENCPAHGECKGGSQCPLTIRSNAEKSASQTVVWRNAPTHRLPRLVSPDAKW